MATVERRTVQFSAPGEIEVVSESIPPPAANEVLVHTKCSAISPGTERLIYEGKAPSNLAADASIDALKGDDLSYPISYGYSSVGIVEEVGEEVDRAWQGAAVFGFQPHTSRFVSSPDSLVRLPEAVSHSDAVLIPSVETAVNFVMDGQPMIGEVVLVFGQGVVGLLTTRLLSDHPLRSLVVVEPSAHRRGIAGSLGASVAVESVSELEDGTEESLSGSGEQNGSLSSFEGADLVYEITGQPSVLNEAIQQTGFAGRLIVGSWYGTKRSPLDLGGHFHRSRMRIISSQVSTIGPTHQGRWTKTRRMSVVLNLLNEVNPGQLISDRFPIDEAPSVYDRLSAGHSMLQPIFEYE